MNQSGSTHKYSVMPVISLSLCALWLNVCFFAATPVLGDDWPMWGGSTNRNMASDAKGIPTKIEPGKTKPDSEEIDLATTKNVKWVAKLGSQTYGNPTVLNGKVIVGTNNEAPRNPDREGDYGVVLCFDEKSGAFQWQLTVPKLGAGKVSDWEYLGICSSAAIDGERVYVVTNRCEVVCLDLNGLGNGNDGPYKDEAKYIAGPGNPPVELAETDADIIWRYDMRDELGVFPHNIASCSPLIVGDRVYTATSNGVDWSHTNVPAPRAPALIALDKNTGELIGEEAEGISRATMHCNWSSPTFGELGGQGQLIFGAGDGFTYGFDPKPIKDDDGFDIFKMIWRFDCNPPHYRTKDGTPIKYATYEGPSELIATPVFYKNRVYVAIGQDPEHGEGIGNLVCIDPSKTGDITKSGQVWSFDKIDRTISTVAIANDLVFAADYAGKLFCLDADNGTLYWEHDTGSHIWGSPFAVDGHVWLGDEDGTLTILATTKEKKVVGEVEFSAPIYSTPIVANGVLYIGTQTHLYAIAEGS